MLPGLDFILGKAKGGAGASISNDIDTILHAQQLQITKFGFGIVTVFSGQRPGNFFWSQGSSVSFISRRVEYFETIIIEMYLKFIHFVI